MTIEIRKIKEPIPYKKIGDLLYKTYYNNYKDSGALQYNEQYAKIYFTSWVLPKTGELIFGAWDNDKLVGLSVGHLEMMKLDNEIEIKSSNIGLTAVDPDYQRQGIATSLILKLKETAKQLGYDMIFAMAQKGKHGDEILKNLEFIKLGKHDHMIKIQEKYGVKILKDYRGLGSVMAKLAETLYSKLPKQELIGTLREGKIPDDIPRCLEILNSYSKRVPLSKLISEDLYVADIKGAAKLNDAFGDPWGLKWFVLEIDGKIMATITCRIEITTFENGSAPVCLMGNLGYDESLDQDQKNGFMAGIIRYIRSNYPKVFTCQITSLHHEQKVMKKLDFTDDQEKYFFMIYQFTDNANEITNRYKRIKEFHLSYFR